MYTFEMYPPRAGQLALPVLPARRGHRPRDDPQQGRGPYLIEQAGCRYDDIGKAKHDCGPLYDDFEIARAGRSTRAAPTRRRAGTWQRADPASTTKQLGTTRRARRRWSPAPRPARSRAPTTSTAARPRSARRSSRCRRPGRRPDVPLLVRARGECRRAPTTFRAYVQRRTAPDAGQGGARQRATTIRRRGRPVRVSMSRGPARQVRIVFQAPRTGAVSRGRGRGRRRADRATVAARSGRPAGNAGTERGPATPRRFDVQRPAVGLDEVAGDREAEPRAASSRRP